MNKAGNILWDNKEFEQRRPEIDRNELRNTLINSLQEGTIKWNHEAKQILPQDGKHAIQFADGQISPPYDLIVGADGAWSKVRPLLSPAKPEYSGMSMVELRYSDAKKRVPHIDQLVGIGMLMATSNGKGILAQQNGNGSIRNYLALRVPEDWVKTCGIDFTNSVECKKELLKLFDDWSDDLKTMITDCDDEIIPRAMYALPVGHKWENKPGLTIIGDAAHLMTPFAGQGANLAMIDGCDLAELIVKKDLSAAVKEFEEIMFPRAAKAASRTASNIKMMFAENAPQEMVDFFKSVIPLMNDPPQR